MAVAYQTSATATYGSASSMTIGKPAGLAVGDGLLVAFSIHSQGAVVTGPVGGGWTKTLEFTPTGTSPSFSLWEKVADAADVAGTGWTFTSTSSGRALGAAYRVTGQDATTVVEASSSNPSAGASSTSHTANSVNGSNEGMVFCFFHQYSGAGDPWTTLTGFTKAHTSDLDSGGNTASHNSMSTQYKALTSTGATGNQTATSSAAAVWGAAQAAVKPATAATSLPIRRWPERGLYMRRRT